MSTSQLASFEFLYNLLPKVPQITKSSSQYISNLFGYSKSLSPLFYTQQVPTPLNVNNHPMLIRAKAGKSKPTVFLVHFEPTFVNQATTQLEWFSATKVEYEPIMKNDTRFFRDLLAHRKPIGCKWVFKV